MYVHFSSSHACCLCTLMLSKPLQTNLQHFARVRHIFLLLSLLSVILFHPLSSSWHTDGRQWFMLAIMGKACCCLAGVNYVLHNVSTFYLSFSDSPRHRIAPTMLSLFPLKTNHTALKLALLSQHTFLFPTFPPSLNTLISFLPRVKITAAN